MSPSMSLRLLLTTLLGFFVSMPALAGKTEITITGSDKNIPRVRSSADQLPEIAWPDGRVAKIKVEARYGVTLSPKFRLIESTCTQEVLAPVIDCQISEDFNSFQAKLIWVKHEDPSKVGNEVLLQSNGQPLMIDNELVSSFLKKTYPAITANLKDVTFECTDWSWLGSMTEKQFTIFDWSNQTMEPNRHTNMNENQATTQSQNISGKMISTNKASLINQENTDHFPGGLIVGDEVGWTLENDNGICEVAWKPENIDDSALNALSTDLSEVRDLSLYKALLKKADRFVYQREYLNEEQRLLSSFSLIGVGMSIRAETDGSLTTVISLNYMEVQ